MGTWKPNENRYYWIDIMSIEEKVYWLIRFRNYLTQFLKTTTTPQVVTLKDIFPYCKRKKEFGNRFFNESAFRKFMERMEDEKYVKQIIKNCDYDKSKSKWKFYRPANKTKTRDSLIEDGTKTLVNSNGKGTTCIAKDGTQLRSLQELHIYEELSIYPHIQVKYEQTFYWNNEYKKPDFTLIINNDNENPYIWEHFGLSENDSYFEKNMADKISWYLNAGFEPFDKGGKLILTIYKDENYFSAKVHSIIEKLKKLV